MRRRFQSEKLTIEHVRNRCERMPVVRMNVRERPDDILPRHAALDLTILADVARIVIINKAVLQSLAEDGPGDRDQYRADRDFRK